MSSLTVWGAAEFTRMMFGKRSALPDAYYLALCLDGSPNIHITGSDLIEPATTAGYARLQLNNTGAVWGHDGQTSAYNVAKLSYPNATTGWGRIWWWALCNSAVAGQIYAYGLFTEPLAVIAGDNAVIPAGALRFSTTIQPMRADTDLLYG